MAVLPAQDRTRVAAHFQRTNTAPFGALTKADIQAAAAVYDQLIEDNAAAFNLALPVAARTGLSAAQKLDLFMLVAERRAGRLRTQEDG